MAQTLCIYESQYLDHDSKENVNYFCQRDSQNGSDYCELHDSTYLENNPPDAVVARFAEELENSSTTKKLVCIGFHLSGINFNFDAFPYPVYFIRCTFHKSVNFLGVSFKKYVIFRETYFTEEFSFDGCIFEDDVEFYSIRVDDGKSINFEQVEFLKSVNFINSKLVNANFENAQFNESIFRNIDFHVLTDFSHSVFQNKADFSKAIFHNYSDFSHSVFQNKADFSDVVFHDSSDFSHSVFQNKADFSDVVFHDSSDFSHSEFNKVFFVKTEFKDYANFENVIFHEQKLSFFNSDLSFVSLLNCDITRIKFGDDTKWNSNKTFEIFDARKLHKNPADCNLQSVLAVYRNLRENFEFHLKYEEAGQFFVNEMELRRKYESVDTGSKMKSRYHRILSLTSFYSYLGRYGEEFNRPLIWALIILGSSLAYYSIFPESENSISPNSIGFSNHVSRVLEKTFSSFLPTNSNYLPDHVIKILSIPVLGALFIALRRRFERRFRH